MGKAVFLNRPKGRSQDRKPLLDAAANAQLTEEGRFDQNTVGQEIRMDSLTAQLQLALKTV